MPPKPIPKLSWPFVEPVTIQELRDANAKARQKKVALDALLEKLVKTNG